VDGYLEIGQKAGASDVHLAVNAKPIWRLNGTLQPIWPDAPLLTSEQTAALAESFVPDVYKTELTARGDSDFAYANEFARYRTSVVRQRLGIEIVFRVINSNVRTMDELELPEHLKLLTRYQNGLILATGSVGTGKSTTLAGDGRASKYGAARSHYHSRGSDRIHHYVEKLPRVATRGLHAH
jgi:twitching motility protein PilT